MWCAVCLFTLLFPLKDLQFCQEYDVKAGYSYSTFFHIEKLKPNQNASAKVDAILNLKLFVLASKDAHILLSPTDQIKSSPVYEIGKSRDLTKTKKTNLLIYGINCCFL